MPAILSGQVCGAAEQDTAVGPDGYCHMTEDASVRWTHIAARRVHLSTNVYAYLCTYYHQQTQCYWL